MGTLDVPAGRGLSAWADLELYGGPRLQPRRHQDVLADLQLGPLQVLKRTRAGTPQRLTSQR